MEKNKKDYKIFTIRDYEWRRREDKREDKRINAETLREQRAAEEEFCRSGTCVFLWGNFTIIRGLNNEKEDVYSSTYFKC
ncbi:hypothetical protein [Haliovirga abyssi]|uniref:Uncharacterized protein n=1 Tax=Haliovirga abyssi TaxID=2996794 RepID=A0AAU9DFP1_9FUSO|nr:hypothetical protein [Haliovirga abyssi]BDU49469.1 hypothetical protein HLVA_00380 [Haliovirga abyssi]